MRKYFQSALVRHLCPLAHLGPCWSNWSGPDQDAPKKAAPKSRQSKLITRSVWLLSRDKVQVGDVVIDLYSLRRKAVTPRAYANDVGLAWLDIFELEPSERASKDRPRYTVSISNGHTRTAESAPLRCQCPSADRYAGCRCELSMMKQVHWRSGRTRSTTR